MLFGEQGGVEVDSSDEWIKSSSTSLWEEDHISSKGVKGVVGWLQKLGELIPAIGEKRVVAG